jgi:hypothetical protein
MNLEKMIKYLIYASVFIVALLGIRALFRSLGVDIGI